MKLGIVGYGILGRAVYEALKDYHDITIIDPPAGYGNGMQFGFDAYVLCLPTPSDKDGNCDFSLISFYLDHITSYDKETQILVKSTIPPSDLLSLEKQYDFSYSPEFLRADSNIADFQRQEFAIFAGNDPFFWYNLFIDAKVYIAKVMFTNMSTASYIKYGINTFLATKVMFFNELEDLFDGELEDITGAMAFDPRIGTSHMQVPGPDGKKGFGGMCFPKDTKAFALYARNQGKPLEILEKVIEINEKIRKW